MFLGHFGVGFGAKGLAPRASLGTLFLAAQLIDLLWPSFLLLGWERVSIRPGITVVTPLDFESYPFTHSLLAVIFWGLGFALVYGAIRRYAAGAIVGGLAVISHWILDLLVHRPDLPLAPGGTRVGLGLWNSLPATLAVELVVFFGGLWIYLRTTRARDRIGSFALAGLVGFLLLIYAGNLMGPPPPSVEAIAWAGQAQWLLVIWAFWIDRHRELVARRADVQ
jgi:hypothetical protein